jgi:hypothetical protein
LEYGESQHLARITPQDTAMSVNHGIDPACYVVTKRSFHSGIFDSSVDATFIVTLVGSPRLQEVQEQLDFIVPTREVYTVYNSVAPGCAKELLGHPVKETYQDLMHAYLYVLQHAAQLKYKGRILILEDDFVWHPRLANKPIQEDLTTFLTSENPRLYALGAVWGWAFPSPFRAGNLKHIWINERAGSHALIISNETRSDLLAMKWAEERKWDIDEVLSSFGGMYMYWQPLCVQCFSNTANKKTYEMEVSYSRKLLVEVGLRFYTALGIDSHCNDAIAGQDLATRWDHVYWSLFLIHMSGYFFFFGCIVVFFMYVRDGWGKQLRGNKAKMNKAEIF